jgi:anti-anti-sigma regulatory factor
MVTHIDAAGIGAIVQAYNQAAAAGADLSVDYAEVRIRSLLDLVGLLGLLRVDSLLALDSCS